MISFAADTAAAGEARSGGAGGRSRAGWNHSWTPNGSDKPRDFSGLHRVRTGDRRIKSPMLYLTKLAAHEVGS